MFRIVIMWKTSNMWSFFSFKGKTEYKSCVFYKVDCYCGLRYIGEIKRNPEVRWYEHN